MAQPIVRADRPQAGSRSTQTLGVKELRTMYKTPNKVLEAARELNLASEAFRQVGPGQWEPVLKSIFEKFANTSDAGVTWLWQHLKNEGVSTQTENGLNFIGSLFEPDLMVWVIFEDWDRTKKNGNYWVFEGNYGAAINVLNNMHGIEYYIVDRKFNWMIMENHHDILIAVGEPAESRLIELKSAQQGTPADAEPPPLK